MLQHLTRGSAAATCLWELVVDSTTIIFATVVAASGSMQQNFSTNASTYSFTASAAAIRDSGATGSSRVPRSILGYRR